MGWGEGWLMVGEFKGLAFVTARIEVTKQSQLSHLNEYLDGI